MWSIGALKWCNTLMMKWCGLNVLWGNRSMNWCFVTNKTFQTKVSEKPVKRFLEREQDRSRNFRITLQNYANHKGVASRQQNVFLNPTKSKNVRHCTMLCISYLYLPTIIVEQCVFVHWRSSVQVQTLGYWYKYIVVSVNQ